MADTTALKNRIRAAIKANDNQEITGPVLQARLLDIVDELNQGTEDEASRAQGAETNLGQRIGEETSRAQDAEANLGQAITQLVTALDTMTFSYNTPEAQQATRAMLDVIITVAGNPHRLSTLILGSATASAAGLMSAEDKVKVDSFLAGIRSMQFVDTTTTSEQAIKLVEQLKWTVDGVQEVISSITLLAATSSKAGLLSASDKEYIDALPAMFTSLSNSISGVLALMQSLVGYYVCDTAAGTAAKTVAATSYALTNGGCIRIKMTNVNTANNVTLNINSTGAKALYYDGEQASATNTWEAGEVLEVYYDGTQYQCASSRGGKFATGEKVKEVSITDTLNDTTALIESAPVKAAVDNVLVNIGYFVCSTTAATAAKVFSATGYSLTSGGHILVFMENANTADDVTLNINSTGAKPLLYNGLRASSTNSWNANEVISVYYNGTAFVAGKATVKELNASRLVEFNGGVYFNGGGYYNSSMEVIANNYHSYTNLIDVSEYVGLIAKFNFTSGRTSAYSGFLNANDEIFGTFQGKTEILIPEGAVKMWVTASGSGAATMSITIKTPLSDAEIDRIFNMNIMEGMRHIQSETTNFGGYYKPDGYTIGSGGYHLKLDVTQYRGMMVTFKPCWGSNTFTGFKLSDDTYLRIPVSNSEDFTYIVPSNAVELRASFMSSQTDRFVVFSIPRTLDDVYNDLLTREDAEDEYVSKDVLTETYNIDTTQCEQGKYYNGNGSIGSASNFYAFKIADFTNFQGMNWIGGTYKIGGHLYTGGVARCGFYNTDNTVTLITSTDQYSGEILPTMKGMFLSFNGDISDAQCDLIKFDTQIVNGSQLEQAVQEAKDYTDEKMAEIGAYKLPNVKWYVLGDSISAYTLYVGAGNHYYEFIAARNNMTFDPQGQVRAADGRTVSATTGNSICYDVANLTAPKIITILAGINDFGHNIPLGTLVDSDGYCVAPPETAAECTDFAKGLLYVLSNLKANYPSAVIIYILPLRNNRTQTNALGLRLEKYWEYIRIACQAYSVPIINLGTECVLMSGGTYYVDGLHPNVNGQKIMSYFIENYMSLLVPTVFP